MTEEQKRFKILKKTSFEEQISQEDKIAVNKAINAGFYAAAAICSLLTLNDLSADTEILVIVFDLLLVMISTGASAKYLKELIESISKKTMLQGKVLDIETELEMPENEESRAMKK